MDFSKKKSLFWLPLKGSIAAAAVWYLFHSGRLAFSDLGMLIQSPNFGVLLVSMLAFLAATLISVVRLSMLLRTIDLNVNMFSCFKITMIGLFFNTIIPGMAGGDIVKGFYLAKTEAQYRGRGSGIVIMDRLIGVIAMVLIAMICLLYLLNVGSGRVQDHRNELLLLFMILSLVGLCSVLAVRYLERFHSKAAVLARSLEHFQFFFRMIEGLLKSMQNRKMLLMALFLSILVQVLSLAGLLVLTRIGAHDVHVSVVALTVVSSIVLILNIVPVTPGNIGWTELLASFGWSVVGSSAGGTVFLYWRLVGILCSLPGGIYYLLSPRKTSSCQKQGAV